VYSLYKSLSTAPKKRPLIHTAKKPEPEVAERVEVPDYGHRSPEEIQAITQAVGCDSFVCFGRYLI